MLQLEGGVKWKTDHLSLFVTPFHATTDETNRDVTCKADGVEFEGAADYGQFNVHGGVTQIRL